MGAVLIGLFLVATFATIAKADQSTKYKNGKLY
jgi:hypothetical protein